MDLSVATSRYVPQFAVACSNCNLRDICLPFGLTKDELAAVDSRLVALRHKVARGETLFQAGDPFNSVYAICHSKKLEIRISPDVRMSRSGSGQGAVYSRSAIVRSSISSGTSRRSAMSAAISRTARTISARAPYEIHRFNTS